MTIECVKIKSAPGVDACVYPGEYRPKGAVPIMVEAPVDLSAVYGEWVDLTGIPPNASFVVTDGRETYAAYVVNSAATVVIKVDNAAKYAVYLIRALEKAGLGSLVDVSTAAFLEHKANFNNKKYSLEDVARKVEALEKIAEELARQVTFELKPEVPHAELKVNIQEPVRQVKTFDNVSWSVEGGVAASQTEVCEKLDRELRELGITLVDFYNRLKNEEFKARLLELLA